MFFTSQLVSRISSINSMAGSTLWKMQHGFLKSDVQKQLVVDTLRALTPFIIHFYKIGIPVVAWFIMLLLVVGHLCFVFIMFLYITQLPPKVKRVPVQILPFGSKLRVKDTL